MNRDHREKAYRKTVVFLGPSLSEADARAIVAPSAHTIYRPPAARGDIEKAVRDGADRICLIDGVFFENCAVGHKELLAALKSGVTVIGAASMGALRACEMAPFGMIGVGTVFEMYRDGVIESDDEVAVLCHPETNEALSQALVNIRKTLEKARDEEILSEKDAEVFLEIAAETYYPERSYENLIDAAARSQKFGECLPDLEKWLAKNARDVKREDAEKALRLIA